jgi:hypothetical protein
MKKGLIFSNCCLAQIKRPNSGVMSTVYDGIRNSKGHIKIFDSVFIEVSYKNDTAYGPCTEIRKTKLGILSKEEGVIDNRKHNSKPEGSEDGYPVLRPTNWIYTKFLLFVKNDNYYPSPLFYDTINLLLYDMEYSFFTKKKRYINNICVYNGNFDIIEINSKYHQIIKDSVVEYDNSGQIITITKDSLINSDQTIIRKVIKYRDYNQKLFSEVFYDISNYVTNSCTLISYIYNEKNDIIKSELKYNGELVNRWW